MDSRSTLLAGHNFPGRKFVNQTRNKIGKCGRAGFLKQNLDQRKWSTQRCSSCSLAFEAILSDYNKVDATVESDRSKLSLYARNFPQTYGASNTRTVLLHESWQSFIHSAELGCSICRLLRHNLCQQSSLTDLEQVSGPINLRRRHRPHSMQIAFPVLVALEYGDITLEVLSIEPDSQDGCFVSAFINSQPFPLFISCDGHMSRDDILERDERIKCVVDYLNFWLDECKQEHKQCQNHNVLTADHKRKSLRESFSRKQPQFVPTRLIHISTDSIGNLSLRLVERGEMANDKRLSGRKEIGYNALSYSWGPGGEFSLTTRANYEERCRDIDFKQLPRTFQDAIEVTRGIGVSYIWIDAFCIIQPTSEDQYRDDWNHEVTLMPEVYRNATLTIAAASAPSVHDGCILKHPERMYSSTPCNIGDLRRETSAIVGDVWIQPSVPEWLNCVSRSALSTRGWCLQERILSTRVVFFTGRGVFWECQELEASEYSPSGVQFFNSRTGTALERHIVVDKAFPFIHSDVFSTRKLEVSPARDFDAASSYWKSLTPTDMTCKGWLMLVENLSRRSFTRSTDKLSAILGIAKMIYARVENSHYLAGIWRSSVFQSLGWFTLIPKDTQDNKKQLRKKMSGVPSWSWASVQNEVIFQHEHMPSYVPDGQCLLRPKALLIDVKDLQGDPVAQHDHTKDAALHLRGQVSSFSSKIFEFSNETTTFAQLDTQARQKASTSEYSTLINVLRVDRNHTFHIDDMETAEQIRDQDPRRLPFKLFSIVTARYGNHNLSVHVAPDHQGLLVIAPVHDDDTQSNVYQRVGWLDRSMTFLSVDNRSRQDRWWDAIIEDGIEQDVFLV